MYRGLLLVRERILGAEHPDTLTVRCNFAFWTGLAGDPAAARDLLADLLPVLERLLVSGPRRSLQEVRCRCLHRQQTSTANGSGGGWRSVS